MTESRIIDHRAVSMLMTATVTPAPGVRTRIPDPRERIADYRLALQHNMKWLGRGLDHIVLVDNSNSDLTPLNEVVRGDSRITLYSYRGVDYPPSYGYGYGEFELVQHAMDSIEVLKRGITAKVTGRYRVMNLDAMLRSLRNLDVYCDIRNANAPWLDMRLMFWTPLGFDAAFRNCYLELRDDVNLLPPEMILALRVLSVGGVRRGTFYHTEPVIDGRRGFDGANWGAGRHALTTAIRNLLRPAMYRLAMYPGAKLDRASKCAP